VLEDVLANLSQGQTVILSVSAEVGQTSGFLAYPRAGPRFAPTRYRPNATIEPGQSVEGTAFLDITHDQAGWEARKDLNFTFRFQYQANLVLAPHAAVMER